MRGFNVYVLAGLVIGILLFVVAPVSAADHIISPGANAIQNEINDAETADGDTILLNHGTYSEYDILVTKNITIGANPADSANAGNTFIDAGGNGRIFSVTGGYNLTIENLTLRNGKAPDGDVSDQYDHTGFPGEYGGAIYSDGLVTVTSSVIRDCRAGNGGAGYDGTDGLGNPGTAGGDGGNGGAIFTSDEAVIDSTTITRCYAGNGGRAGSYYAGTGATGGGGGAVYVMNFLTITSSSITDCAAGNAGSSPADGGNGGDGGGIYTANSTPYPPDYNYLDMRFTTITNCSAGTAGNAGAIAEDGGSGGSGGGVYSTYPATTITFSTITRCNATPHGIIRIPAPDSIAVDGHGGGYGGWGFGGGLTMENSTLTRNWAPVGGGIGLDEGGHGTTTVLLSNISYNNATTGGGIFYHGHLVVTSSNFVGNSGGAINADNGQLSLNRFYSNLGTAVQSQWSGQEIDAANNWWGTNAGPSGYTGGPGAIYSSPWLMLCATAMPTNLAMSEVSMNRANLTFNNASLDTSASGYVPDAIPVWYTVASGGGTFDVANGGTANGKNATAFSPGVTGLSTIRTTVDGQYVDNDVFVPIAARFTGTPTTGPAPLFVQFNDTSDCTTPLMWNWSLGDGTWFNTTDILQRNASTTYTAPGTYSVSLTIADATGSNTSTRVDYISVRIPPPTVSAITPATGINTTSVSITHLAGTDFNTTHSPVSVKLNRTGFTDIGATDITVVDSTNITCRFDLTGRQAGSWNIVVTNPDNQDGMLAGGFEIQTTTPVITGSSPASGFNSSNLESMTIDGSGFWPGTTTTGVLLRRTGYADISATNVTVSSAAQISCTFDLTSHAAGTWDVVVTNPDSKTATRPGAFEIYPPVPAVTAITPPSGVNTTTVDITNLAGSGFWPGSPTGVILNGTGFPDITASDVTVVNGRTITCRFNIAGQEEGIRNVVVTNPDGQVAMLENGFRIWAPGPQVSGITPASGVNITTVYIANLAGSGFWTSGTTNVYLNRTGSANIITASDITVVDSTNITCRFDIAGREEGFRNVVVTNPDGQEAMLENGFRIWAPAPTIISITPMSGANNTEVSITDLSGTGFWQSGITNVYLNRTGSPDTIIAGHIAVADSTRITCTFDLNGQEAGLRNVVVTNPDGQEAMLENGFTVRMPGPGITGIVPRGGYPTGLINISSLSGSGFWTTGTTRVFLNRTGYPEIPGTNITVVDRSNITCTFDLAGQEPGGWNIVVVNPDGQEMMYANGFWIWAPEPVPTTQPVPTPVPSADSSDYGESRQAAAAAVPTATSCESGILQNVSVNAGGSSAVSRAQVGGYGISGLILTGTVFSGPESGPLPPGTVYQYIDLVPARYCSITSAGIFFSVHQSWLDANGIAPGSIVLYQVTADGWNVLPTTMLSTKDGTAYYSAQSGGLTRVAVAGTPGTPAPVTSAATPEIISTTLQEQAPAVPATAAATTETTAPAAPAPAPATSSAFPLVPVLAVLGCAVLVGGGWYARRWWIRRQNPALFREYD